MQRIISYFRLVRWVNLLFIALTQTLVQYTLIVPMLGRAGAVPTLHPLEFFLLVLATVLVAAGGYVINDYFDVNLDEVNKPRRIFIDRTIHRRSAMLLHQLLTGLGVVISFYVAWKAGNLKLGLVHAIVAAFLWFYSAGYKRKLLAGNVLVSFLTALVVLIVALYEGQLFRPTSELLRQAASSVLIIVFYYFIFSFLISFARELVKDLQDLKGDRMYGSKTIPILVGVKKTKWLVAGVLVLIVMLLGNIQWMEISGRDYVSALTLFTTIEFPILVALYLLLKAQVPKQFAAVSEVIKIVMFMGILSMLYFYFLQH
jgi:4-hydroxybenzoate polyprenyltransferase